jgi:hypothetical protein
MIWFIIGAVCTGFAGYHYGKLVGINIMLRLGTEVYPNFKHKVTQHVMNEGINK